MAFLLRIVWLLILVLFLRWLFSWLFSAGISHLGQRNEPPPPQIHGTAHKDPQCGLYIAEELALAVQVGDQTHYFCSPACRDRYLSQRQ